MRSSKQFYPYLPSVLVAVVSVLLVQTFVSLSRPPQIVSVDIQALTQTFVRVMAASQQSEMQKEAAITAFAQRLDHALKELAHKKHWLIVPSQAVISGGVDVTRSVRIALEHHE